MVFFGSLNLRFEGALMKTSAFSAARLAMRHQLA
jgi:hypothetical protein